MEALAAVENGPRSAERTLDPIPGMSAVDRLRLEILLVRDPCGIPVRMHRFEGVPTRTIKSAADVRKLVDGQRAFVIEQILSHLDGTIPVLEGHVTPSPDSHANA